MENRETVDSAVAKGNASKKSQHFSNLFISKYDCGSASWHIRYIYILIFVIFLTQFACFYYLYSRYRNIDIKYDARLKEIEHRLKYNNVSLHRVKRDVEVKDNSIMKPAANEIKTDITEAELTKNDSTLTIDEVIHLKQTNLSAEDWIWLNKYSRVPLKIMEEFCKTTHDKCPPQKGDPGEKGDRGEIGEKGDKGQDGSIGQKGSNGNRGPIGPPGIRGEKGEKGNQGLDGRPSVPGEPGLDGIPGRNGKDGIPGQKGEPGRNGIPGINGSNGINGEKGAKGESGEKGEKGEQGLAGRRGSPGKSGTDGIPGQPGISARNCSVNGTNKLLIPPTIVGSEQAFNIRNITVREHEHLKLTCKSTGSPPPVNTWRRIEDGSQVPVPQGQWGEINSALETLTFKNISRRSMGEYMCFADNGIPPPANQTFYLNVYFPPYIAIHSVILNVTQNRTALLSCKIEAFPRGVYYWETAQGELLEESTGRFLVDYKHYGLYETELTLNITNVQKEDLGIYYCIGKNIVSMTQGYINVTDNPRRETAPATEVCNRQRITYFGDPPPPSDGILCPQCQVCKNCGFGYNDLEFKMLANESNTAFVRKRNCEMDTIGKPVYHNSMSSNIYGGWMKDSYVMDTNDIFWITVGQTNNSLLEFANKSAFTAQSPTHMHVLSDWFTGNDHIIYNRTFYYYANTKKQNATLVKYDLNKKIQVDSLSLTYCDSSSENHLYKNESNNVDIMADDTGIWIVCGIPESNNTAVIKVNITSFKMEYVWNISIKHQDIGDMFIICGVLYAVQSTTDFNTRISFALDLYKSKLLDDASIITFTNPFKNTVMISYNSRLNELYTWDYGNMLTYPIKLNELSTDALNGNETQSENSTPQNETLVKKN